MCGSDCGRGQFRPGGKVFQQCRIVQNEIEHRAEKLRIAGGRPQGLGAEPGLGEKPTKLLGIGCDMAKRLNRHGFRGLPGCCQTLGTHPYICLSVTYRL